MLIRQWKREDSREELVEVDAGTELCDCWPKKMLHTFQQLLANLSDFSQAVNSRDGHKALTMAKAIVLLASALLYETLQWMITCNN